MPPFRNSHLGAHFTDCSSLCTSRGEYGESYFGLGGTYFEGRAPKSVNFYWRRFRVDTIPTDDSEKFDVWLRERWYEKDALMEQYISTGRFPPLPGALTQAGTRASLDFVETEVRTKRWWEFGQIFVVIGVFAFLGNILAKIRYSATHVLS